MVAKPDTTAEDSSSASFEPLLVGDRETLAEVLPTLEGPLAVDTEFHGEFRYRPRLMLIQICTADGRVLLIDPRAIEKLGILGRTLSKMSLITHAGQHDLPLLKRAARLRVGTVEDTQILAGFAGLGYPTGLGVLLERVLGLEKTPSSALTDWSKRPLGPSQLDYAARDVRHLHALVRALEERVGPERAALASRVAAEQVAHASAPVDPERVWRTHPGVQVLCGRGREILRRLLKWRLAEAAQRNMPLGQVVGNGAILDLARRLPTSVETLLENRRASRGLVRRHGEFFVELVAEVMALPESELPAAPPNGPRLRAAGSLLSAWGQMMEVEEGIGARLLMPPELASALAVAHHEGDDITPLVGWREPWRDVIERLLNGEASLSMKGARATI